MLAIGFEGTAHTFGVGIVDGRGRVLANETDMLRPTEGGIHPREAANHHAEVAAPLLAKALQAAGLRPRDLDVVAFSIGPGLGPCLSTTATAARAFALSAGLPLVGVNHCVAHLEIGRGTTDCKDPVLLYASGANTQVIAYAAGRYRVFGETLDVGVGNMLDKFGRLLGFPFPGGPRIEELARDGHELLPLPYSVKGMDVALSGILTAAAALRASHRREDVAFSLQETVFAMLTEVTERAMAHLGRDEVLLGGGVACNRRLREMVDAMARDRGARSFAPERSLLVDNGAMIAYTGLLMHRDGGVRHAIEDTRVDQRFRTDDVDVTWR